MKKRDHSPGVESLEKKDLLSALGVGLPNVAAVDAARGVRHHPIRLDGTVSGTWTSRPAIPEIGLTQALTGAGTVQPLGQVHAEGTMHAPGFIAEGRATGTITLSTARGSVTLELTSAPQTDFSMLPDRFIYKIVAASGNARGATGHGIANLREFDGSATPAPGPPGMANPLFIISRSFTLSLHPGAR